MKAVLVNSEINVNPVRNCDQKFKGKGVLSLSITSISLLQLSLVKLNFSVKPIFTTMFDLKSQTLTPKNYKFYQFFCEIVAYLCKNVVHFKISAAEKIHLLTISRNNSIFEQKYHAFKNLSMNLFLTGTCKFCQFLAE